MFGVPPRPGSSGRILVGVTLLALLVARVNLVYFDRITGTVDPLGTQPFDDVGGVALVTIALVTVVAVFGQTLSDTVAERVRERPVLSIVVGLVAALAVGVGAVAGWRLLDVIMGVTADVGLLPLSIVVMGLTIILMALITATALYVGFSLVLATILGYLICARAIVRGDGLLVTILLGGGLGTAVLFVPSAAVTLPVVDLTLSLGGFAFEVLITLTVAGGFLIGALTGLREWLAAPEPEEVRPPLTQRVDAR